MDTDKNGKVSKEEFMRFMEAELELADKNKDGELDPKELQYLQFRLSHPTKDPGR
jgi:Ca2+-binding EF-hand superfamily protein